jgi:hypothetical protein
MTEIKIIKSQVPCKIEAWVEVGIRRLLLVKVVPHVVGKHRVHQLAQVHTHSVLDHLDVLGAVECMVAPQPVVEEVAGVLLDDALEKVLDKQDLVEGVGAVSDDLLVAAANKFVIPCENACTALTNSVPPSSGCSTASGSLPSGIRPSFLR